MSLANNPSYIPVFESKTHKGLILYAPASGIEYHTSRYLAAGAQDIFSSSGATKEVAANIYKQVKQICHEAHQKKNTAAFMDINTLMDNLMYRQAYPIDELCAIRMGAIFCFMEDENPDVCSDAYTRHKVELATGNFDMRISPDPDLYTFFLSMGVIHTPAYAQLQNILSDTNYLSNRREALASLIPHPLPTE